MRKHLIILVVWLIGGCTPLNFVPSPSTPPTNFTSPLVLPSASPLSTPRPELARPVQRAIDDLARRLKLTPAQIQLETVSSDEFPAGDLGCPQPDQPSRALPAIISGQRVLLLAQGTRYEYRTAGSDVVYCGAR
jgi:hypothetical protein